MIPPPERRIVVHEGHFDSIRELREHVSDVGGVFKSRPARRGPGSEGDRGVGVEKLAPLAGGLSEGAREVSASDGARSQATRVAGAFGDNRNPILFGHCLFVNLAGVVTPCRWRWAFAVRFPVAVAVTTAVSVCDARTEVVPELVEVRWRSPRLRPAFWFSPVSFGFRPKRSAHQALEAIRVVANRGAHWVLDADIKAC